MVTREEANKKFCEQFTYLKNSRDLSYRDIERGADVPHSCISHWLSGKGLPNGFAIMKLCDFFGVTADYLLGSENALTPDDIETIRIHLGAVKGNLCNQRRWKEAEEYERLIKKLLTLGGNAT